MTFNGRVSTRKCVPGTIVTIQSLFGNFPVRQKQLSSTRAKTISLIKAFCLRMAIMNANISFEVLEKSICALNCRNSSHFTLETHTNILRVPAVVHQIDRFPLLCGELPISRPKVHMRIHIHMHSKYETSLARKFAL